MRAQIACAIAALLLANSGIPTPVALAQNPSADQIVKSLTPTAPQGATRGIRLTPATGAAGQTGTAAPTRNQTGAATAPSVSLTVQFATGSAELTPQAIQTLNELGRALTDPTLTAYRFRIEGHTDTVGRSDYNQVLSERRAAAVAEYIASNFHVARNRIEPIGMGEAGLLIPTPEQTAEPRNRRVQVVNIGS